MATLQQVNVTNRLTLKRALKQKYGTLTQAAANLELPYDALSAVLGGRKSLFYVVGTLQNEFELSDKQVLEFWPLIKRWPRPDREAS